MKRMTIALGAALLLSGAMAIVGAQDLVSSAGTLVFGTTVMQTDAASTQEELPGLGHKFELLGAMRDDTDPENPTNDVIAIDTTGGALGLAYRDMPPGIKISALDNQVGLKYYFVAPRTCFGGSPRLDLLIDGDGDGVFSGASDFVAHGHVNPPLTTACPAGDWVYENMSDHTSKRWETTPLAPVACGPGGAATMCTWDELEMRVTALFPNHRVLAGFLLDGESCGFSAPLTNPGCGKAYYDLVTIENRTLENDQDTVKNGH